MTIRYSLLALSALTLPAAALAQYGAVARAAAAAAGLRRRRAPWSPSRGWRSRRRRRAQPWQSPAARAEPRAGARADRSAAGDRAGRRHDLHRPGAGPARGPRQRACCTTCRSTPGAARRSTSSLSVNPIYTDLRRGLVKYQQRWGDLPQVADPGRAGAEAGLDRRARRACCASGSGLPPATASTPRSPPRSRNSRRSTASRPTASPAPARSTRSTAAPNYYEQLIIINMERAKRLPAPEEQRKYAIVDAGDARLSL